MVGFALRHSDTLYCLLQRKQEEFQKCSQQSGKDINNPWICQSASELRECLSDMERHIVAHYQETGCTLEKWIPEQGQTDMDIITRGLKAVKVFLYSAVNMSSEYFRSDDSTPRTIQSQIAEAVDIIEDVKSRLRKWDVASPVVENGTSGFLQTVTNLTASYESEKKETTDQNSQTPKDDVEVFEDLLHFAEKTCPNSKGNQQWRVDDKPGYDNSGDDTEQKEAEMFERIVVAVKEATDELTKRGGTDDGRNKQLAKLIQVWSAWQIEKEDITYDFDKHNEKLLLGRGGQAIVYAGYLRSEHSDDAEGLKKLPGKNSASSTKLPVAVKMKFMDKDSTADVLREVFLHLMVQHHRIITLYGMWYPPQSQQALIVYERMSRTLEHALNKTYNEIHHWAILLDVSAALAHLHDRGIVHRDVKPSNILLNERGTEAKLADFGISRRRSLNTLSTIGTQQAGTPFYMAPEVRQNSRCKTTTKLDSWGFGLLLCEVIHPGGKHMFLTAQHRGVHDAAMEWACGIINEQLRIAAMACLQHAPEDRPKMRDVYLHLHGGPQLQIVPSCSCAYIENATWKPFYKVNTALNSENTMMRIENKSEAAVELCSVSSDGQLQPWIQIDRNMVGQVEKQEKDGGVSFVIRDKSTKAFRAAFVGNGMKRTVIVGSNFVYVDGIEANKCNKGKVSWPLHSAKSADDVEVTISNNFDDEWYMLRVDDGGQEQLVTKIGRKREMRGRLKGGSILVFRHNAPGEKKDRTFVYAACLSTIRSNFFLKLGF